MDFRNDIQGLRALAVIFVFLFHLEADWLPGGFIGVDIFFVISGYLVSSIIMHKIDKGSFSIVSFYEGRVKRIVPAYLFFLIITSIIAAILFVKSDLESYRLSLFWTILFNSNNHFATLDNYFGASSHENPLLHTWTLAVEMQFYLILPLLLILIKNRKMLIGVLVVLFLALTGYSTYNIFNGNSGLMYFSLPSRMPEFILGILAASLNLRGLSFVKINSGWLSTIGLLTLIISGIALNESVPFPGATALIPCFGAVCLLIASDNRVNDFFSNKALVFIGEVSYSVYLWHWPIMAFWRYYKNEYEFSGAEKVSVFVVTICASLVSYYLIEKSLRTKKRFSFYIPFLALGAASLSLVVLTKNINAKVFEDNAEFMYPSFGLASHGATFTEVEILGDQTDSIPEILFLGDSHALVMKKYFDVIGSRNNFSLKTITNNTYPTIPGLTEKEIGNKDLLAQYNKLMNYVNVEIPKSKLIIIQFAGNGEKWAPFISELLTNLEDSQRILILEDFPILDKNPIRVNRGIVKNSDIEQTYELIYEPMSSVIKRQVKLNPSAKILSFSSSRVFEDAPFYRDTLMYYDSGHLNVYGANAYALSTEQQILKEIHWGINE